MIDLTLISEDELGQTPKYMRRELIKRGWKAEIPYIGSAHYFLVRSDGKKLHIFSSTPPTTSFAAASLANDKFATYQLLKDSNVPQLDTIKVSGAGDLNEAIGFLKDKKTVVVKPIDGGHGKGITVNVTNESDLKDAVVIALAQSKYIHAAIVQKQYPHDAIYDLRILTINYKYVAAIYRVAARVFGDGIHNVLELIEIENATERRGKAYHTELATIDVEKARTYMKDKIKNIPSIGEEVSVLGIANYGAGGETVDVTDNLPDWLIKNAEEASLICELPVAGVDFMLARFPEINHTQEDLDVSMTEINKAPLLTMHDTPTSGISRSAVSKYIGYLSSL